MTTTSNLYAEKIYSEHPVVLWALDEKLDYRNFVTDTVTIGGAGDIWEPFGAGKSSNIDAFVQNYSLDPELTAEIPLSPMHISNPKANNIYKVNYFDCDPDSLCYLETKNFTTIGALANAGRDGVCIGFYYYSVSSNYNYLKFGIAYKDPETLETIKVSKTVLGGISDEWVFVSDTFNIPEGGGSTELALFIEVDTTTGSTNPEDYRFYFHGTSLGELSEEFCSSSEGLKINSNSGFFNVYPSNIPATGFPLVTCAPYGLERPLTVTDAQNQKQTAYYLYSGVNSKNAGIPLVYGSSGSTRMYPTGLTSPSLIVPGNGMLNNIGKYSDYTLEFWTSIHTIMGTSPSRIVGPINSFDGIYVDNGFITLAIGSNIKSFFVGEWGRPMLINLRYGINGASLMINGEQVISMTFSANDLLFPDEFDGDGKNQDYIGFYSPSGVVQHIDLDCVAIYSYQVPSVVAKRRYVYGQGVPSAENILSSFAGSAVEIDYSVAEYAADYNYPDMASWNQAVFDNVDASGVFLKTPGYNLPNFYINDPSGESFVLQDLYPLNYFNPTTTSKYFTLNPGDFLDDKNAYFLIDSLNFLNQDINLIYGIFEVDSTGGSLSTDATLFKIFNKENNDYFRVYVDQYQKINYQLFFNGVTNTIAQRSYTLGEKFVAGIKISEIINVSTETQSFFSNFDKLSMYILGDTDTSNVFKRRVYGLAFSTVYASNKSTFSSSSYINSSGIINELSGSLITAVELYDHPSYKIVPKVEYDQYFLDVLVSGYWEDYVPLSYLSTYINGEDGKQYYGLDFIQFNIDYPEIITPTIETSTSSWTYDGLRTGFAIPAQSPYQLLDNQNYTNWDDYTSMNFAETYSRSFDFTNQNVKTYITFQYVSDGSLVQNNYTSTIGLNENKVVDLSSTQHINDWRTKRFQVLNGTIIIPPTGINTDNLAIVYRVEFESCPTFGKTIAVKKLQLASQALSHNNFQSIGTKYGSYIYPYVKNNLYYDYKAKNPFAIYKDSSKYLYLTNNSGIEVRELSGLTETRGVAVPINSNSSDDFIVSSMQIWFRPNIFSFPVSKKPIFEFEYGNTKIVFYCIANSDSGLRGKIFAEKIISAEISTVEEFTGLSFYQNGNYTATPTISLDEWVSLGIQFNENINLSNTRGYINLVGLNYVFNNIAYYQATNLDLAQTRTFRSWNKVKNDINPLNPSENIDLDWQYWQTKSWNQVYISGTQDLYRVNPQDVYKTYIGTNKIVAGDFDKGISLEPNKIKMYADSVWQGFTSNPV